MNATLVWRGDAVAVSQVLRITPGAVEAGRDYTLRINFKDITVQGATGAALMEAFALAIDASQISEWREVTATREGSTLILTSQTPGVPFEVSTLVDGFALGGAVVVKVAHGPSGTWAFSAADYGTANINANESQVNVQTIMDGLFGVGNTIVRKRSFAGYLTYTVEFTGSMGGKAVPTVSVDYANLTGGDAALDVRTIQEAVAGTSEVQTITLFGGATDGTFSVTYLSSTIICDHDESLASMQAKARAMPEINGPYVTITGTPGSEYVWTFSGALGHRALEPLVVETSNLIGGSIYAEITTIADGEPAVNSKFYIYAQHYLEQNARFEYHFSGVATGGTYTIHFGSTNVSGIPYNATNSEIADLIETAAGKRGCIVSGGVAIKSVYLVGELNSAQGNWGITAPTVSGLFTLIGATVTRDYWLSGSYIYSTDSLITWTIGSSSVNTVLARSAPLSAIQAALDTAFGAGNAVVTMASPSSGTWPGLVGGNILLVEFIGDLAGTNTFLTVDNPFPQSLYSSVYRIQYQQGSIGGGVSETQVLTVYGAPTQGYLNLGLNGEKTSNLAYNSSAPACEAGLIALPNLGPTDVNAADGPLPANPVTFVFGGQYGYMDVTEMTVDDNGLKQRVVRTVEGVTGKNEIQRLSLTGQDVWAGALTLTHDGDTTAAVAWDADYPAVLAALETATSSTNFDASGGPWPELPIDVEFVNLLAETDVPLITSTSSLTNGTAIATSYDPLIINRDTPATGENYFNQAVNWYNPEAPGTVRPPERGDTLYFTEGNVDVLYGTVQIVTFAADTVNDVLVLTKSHDLQEGQAVEVWSTDTLPTGLAANTAYYIVDLDPVTGNFALATTAGGVPINLTAVGTGTHWVGVRLNKIVQFSTYTGKIGLPWMAGGGYKEYRALDLEIGLLPAGAKLITIGQGTGIGSGRISIFTGIDALTFECVNTGGTADRTRSAVNWRGEHAAAVMRLLGGDFGIALRPTESAVFATIEQRAGTLSLGEDVSFVSLDKTGGTIKTINGATLSGVLKIRG